MENVDQSVNLANQSLCIVYVSAWQYMKSTGTSLQSELCYHIVREWFSQSSIVQIGMHHVLQTVLYTVQKNV